MLLFTIFFISYYLSIFLRINFIHSESTKLAEMVIKLAEINNSANNNAFQDFMTKRKVEYLNKQLTGRAIRIILFSLIFVILEIVYFVKAYPMDIFKYPTIIMIITFIILIFKQKNNKIKTIEDIEEFKKRAYSLKGAGIANLISLTYYLYMLYIIVSVKGP